jgi:hypothetical protein
MNKNVLHCKTFKITFKIVAPVTAATTHAEITRGQTLCQYLHVHNLVVKIWKLNVPQRPMC